MARQNTYIKDGEVQGGDKWLITDIVDGATKNLTVEDLAQFFAETGTADPSKLGFRFDYAGTIGINDNPIVEPGQYYIVGGPGFANVTRILVSNTTATGESFLPVRRIIQNNDIKFTDVTGATSNAYGYYQVDSINIGDYPNATALDVIHVGGDSSVGNFSLIENAVITPIGAPSDSSARGVHIFDGTEPPMDNDETTLYSNGDLYFQSVTDPNTGFVSIVFWGPYNNGWGDSGVNLTGEQGVQGIGVTNFSGDQDGVQTSITATTVTVTGIDPEDNSEVDLGTFGIPSGIQGVQGTGVTAITQTNTPELGQDTDLTVSYNNPGGLPADDTFLTVKAGVQGDQGISYLALFRVVEKNSAGIAPVPSAPEGVVYNRNTGYTNLPIDQWNSNPIAHAVQSESLFEVRQDFNPATAFDTDGNVTFTAASWGQAFVAGDIGPTGPQGVGLIDNGNAFVSDQAGVATSSNASIITVTGVDPSDNNSTVDLGTFTIPSGIKGDQGFQGVNIDIDNYTPNINTTPGTNTPVSIPLDDPSDLTTPGPITFTIPPGVDGKEVDTVVSSILNDGRLQLVFNYDDGSSDTATTTGSVAPGPAIQDETITEWSATDTYQIGHVVYVETNTSPVFQLNFYTALAENTNSRPSTDPPNSNWGYRGAVDARQQLFNDLSNVDVDTTEAATFRTAISAISDDERTKLTGIEAGAQVNVGVEYTQTEKDKLGGIEEGAQVNVGVEFTQTEKTKLSNSNVNTTARTVTIGDDSIGIPGTSGSGGVTLAGHSVTELDDVSNAGSGEIISGTERTKLTNSNITGRVVTIGNDSITIPGSGTGGGTNLSGHSVTELDDVTNAGSGAIITDAERTAIGTNSGKTSFPGFGTTSGTAAEGDKAANVTLTNLTTLSSDNRDTLNTSLGVLTSTVEDSSNKLVTSNGIYDYIDGLGLATDGDIITYNFNDTSNSGTTLGVDFSVSGLGSGTEGITGTINASDIAALPNTSNVATETLHNVTIGGTTYMISGAASAAYSFNPSAYSKQLGDTAIEDFTIIGSISNLTYRFDSVQPSLSGFTIAVTGNGTGSKYGSNFISGSRNSGLHPQC